MSYDFTKITVMQEKLDATYKSNGVLNDKLVDKKRVLALLVEIGEFANEYAPFKYWKKQKNVDRKLVIEEFVDGIHFFASIINKTRAKVTKVNYKVVSDDKSIQLLHTFDAVVKIFKEPARMNVLYAFELYLGNAKLLGISFDEIETAYIEKNKINFKRIENGY